jgi:hypothetical protein
LPSHATGTVVDEPFVDPQAKVTGEFITPHKVKGTIKVSGELAGAGSDCHSAKLTWKAQEIL